MALPKVALVGTKLRARPLDGASEGRAGGGTPVVGPSAPNAGAVTPFFRAAWHCRSAVAARRVRCGFFFPNFPIFSPAATAAAAAAADQRARPPSPNPRPSSASPVPPPPTTTPIVSPPPVSVLILSRKRRRRNGNGHRPLASRRPFSFSFGL